MNEPDAFAATGKWQGEEPEAKASAPDVPQKIGRYRIEKVLGEGGFGRVYLAHDDDLNRPVAIKVPHRSRLSSEEDATVFLVEARVVASLDHPGIVPVYDVGRADDGSCYIVSKLIEGTDLSARIKEPRPSHAESAPSARHCGTLSRKTATCRHGGKTSTSACSPTRRNGRSPSGR